MTYISRITSLLVILVALVLGAIFGNASVSSNETSQSPTTTETNQATYSIMNVIDGDTIDVKINGEKKRIRLIGVNTPETVDPRKPVECFGREASAYTKQLLSDKLVYLESDPTQDDQDKYGRLLRYVFLTDGTNVNQSLIANGYAYEYTYESAYKYQAQFKQAQKQAEIQKLGLWGDVCRGTTSTQNPDTITTTHNNGKEPTNNKQCIIKGNISTKGEKVYHLPTCESYAKTSINESTGERWFCSESEAQSAGWRKALNC